MCMHIMVLACQKNKELVALLKDTKSGDWPGGQMHLFIRGVEEHFKLTMTTDNKEIQEIKKLEALEALVWARNDNPYFFNEIKFPLVSSNMPRVVNIGANILENLHNFFKKLTSNTGKECKTLRAKVPHFIIKVLVSAKMIQTSRGGISYIMHRHLFTSISKRRNI